jgi:hypothetical protein
LDNNSFIITNGSSTLILARIFEKEDGKNLKEKYDKSINGIIIAIVVTGLVIISAIGAIFCYVKKILCFKKKNKKTDSLKKVVSLRSDDPSIMTSPDYYHNRDSSILQLNPQYSITSSPNVKS